MIWPSVITANTPEERYAWIRTVASAESLPAYSWGQAMIEHVERALGQGWPLHRALSKAAAECTHHLPKAI